ncbi:MAG: DUF1566 domain-containing protein [Candidatus Symbiothrix sp.]|jgi:hypothetical protein|nr:DUF1566 domain-containing protein [Candidatus Symbiothrix sp.]
MKRKYLFLLVAALLVTGNYLRATAQVAIGTGTGTDGNAATGAVLELDGEDGGLLLPKVTITNITALPTEWVSKNPALSTLVGTLVWNKGLAPDIPVGLYILKPDGSGGYKWTEVINSEESSSSDAWLQQAKKYISFAPVCQGLIVPNSRTGFIPGVLNPEPTTPTPSGSLCVYKWDGNGGNQTTNGTTKTWDSMTGQSGAWYQTNSFTNPDGSIFIGANAGCASGFRLPSVIELNAIMAYFNTYVGGYNAPDGSTIFPSWKPMVANEKYWSSSINGVDELYVSPWGLDGSNGTVATYRGYNSYYVRCVKDL